MRKFVFLFLFFLLVLSTARAETKGGYSELYFVSEYTCESYATQSECMAAGCYWFDDSCHSEISVPIGTTLLCQDIDDEHKICIVIGSMGVFGLVLMKKERINWDEENRKSIEAVMKVLEIKPNRNC